LAFSAATPSGVGFWLSVVYPWKNRPLKLQKKPAYARSAEGRVLARRRSYVGRSTHSGGSQGVCARRFQNAITQSCASDAIHVRALSTPRALSACMTLHIPQKGSMYALYARLPAMRSSVSAILSASWILPP
jgi:hypothetical protein